MSTILMRQIHEFGCCNECNSITDTIVWVNKEDDWRFYCNNCERVTHQEPSDARIPETERVDIDWNGWVGYIATVAKPLEIPGVIETPDLIQIGLEFLNSLTWWYDNEYEIIAVFKTSLKGKLLDEFYKFRTQSRDFTKVKSIYSVGRDDDGGYNLLDSYEDTKGMTPEAELLSQEDTMRVDILLQEVRDQLDDRQNIILTAMLKLSDDENERRAVAEYNGYKRTPSKWTQNLISLATDLPLFVVKEGIWRIRELFGKLSSAGVVL